MNKDFTYKKDVVIGTMIMMGIMIASSFGALLVLDNMTVRPIPTPQVQNYWDKQ